MRHRRRDRTHDLRCIEIEVPRDLVGAPTGERFIEDHTECMDVDPRIDLKRRELELLGRHVGGRPDERACDGLLLLRGIA
jgi:hypothetical protein